MWKIQNCTSDFFYYNNYFDFLLETWRAPLSHGGISLENIENNLQIISNISDGRGIILNKFCNKKCSFLFKYLHFLNQSMIRWSKIEKK